MKPDIAKTYLIELPEQASALINPLRAEILSQAKEPRSATEIAKLLQETPQRINYHIKMLEKVNLVRRVGTRQVRNLVEVLYQSIAHTFLLAESLSIAPHLIQKMKDQGSLMHLIHTSERMKKDALLLMEQSEQEEEIPSASIQMQLHLTNEEQRKQFIDDYVEMVKQLIGKYQSKSMDSTPYQVLVAIYPELVTRSDQDD